MINNMLNPFEFDVFSVISLSRIQKVSGEFHAGYFYPPARLFILVLPLPVEQARVEEQQPV